MLFLWVFGDNVEDNFGSFPYLIFYLLSGFGAVLAQALLTPQSEIPSIGASGAISGVLAAYLLLYPGASIRALLFIFIFFTVVRVPAWLMIIIWFGTQLLNGLASVTSTARMTGGVAYGAHIGGFIAGALAAVITTRGHCLHDLQKPVSLRMKIGAAALAAVFGIGFCAEVLVLWPLLQS
jgi:membrane associated rhomboid family serine protease